MTNYFSMKLKQKRKKLNKKIYRQLIEFFNGIRCVISSSIENCDWHHLDDNPGNTTFSNLVPISRDYNNKLENYRRYQLNGGIWKGYDEFLAPESLLLLSRRYFRFGEIAQAYGCSRIATWLIKNYPSIFNKHDSVNEDYLYCVLQTLSCARHAASPILIEDIIFRDLNSVVIDGITNPAMRIQLGLELAALLQEYGYFQDADEVFCLLEDAIKRHRYSRDLFLGRLWRRVALLKVASSTNLIHAGELLEEADKLVSQPSANLHVGVVNAQAWRSLSKGNPIEAIDMELPVIKKIFLSNGNFNRDLVAPWNALESIMTYTRALESIEKNIKSRRLGAANEQMEYMLEYFGRKAIQLRPLAYDLSVKVNGYTSKVLLNKYEKHLRVRSDFIGSSLLSCIRYTIRLLGLHDRKII